jgi:hypothetical protein
MQCSNKVRQISIATHVYIDVYTVLPPAGTAINGVNDTTNNNGKLNSGFIALLQGLEQTALYNALTDTVLGSAATTEAPGTPLNTRLSTFICPSDSFASGSGANQTRPSYRINLGSGGYADSDTTAVPAFTTVSVTGSPTSGTAGVGPFKIALIGDATSGHPGDGFSNTLFFTEKKVARNNATSGTMEDKSGLLFASGYPAQTGLSTAAKPGTVSTTAAAVDTEVATPTASAGYFASSFHTNGVNTSFGDGAGKFINTSIDAGLWASLGTAGGLEAATPP